MVLGYAGGNTFEDSLWKPLIAGLALAALFSAASRLVYSWRNGHLPGPEGAAVPVVAPDPD